MSSSADQEKRQHWSDKDLSPRDWVKDDAPKVKKGKNEGEKKDKQKRGVGPPPTFYAMDKLTEYMRPFVFYMSPLTFGIERIPTDRPILFIGNHSLYALDVGLFFNELWTKKKMIVRPLGDHAHFTVPLWKDLITTMGVVEGTPENCQELMSRGENILVYPGGAREVFKQQGSLSLSHSLTLNSSTEKEGRGRENT